MIIRIKKKIVKIHDLSSGREYTEKYDKLVLSPGASPIIPPIEGTNLPGVFSLRSLPDMDHIRDFISEFEPKNAVVVGGGFIGLEIETPVESEVVVATSAASVVAPATRGVGHRGKDGDHSDNTNGSVCHRSPHFFQLYFSTIRPALRTYIWSAARTVDRR